MQTIENSKKHPQNVKLGLEMGIAMEKKITPDHSDTSSS